ncbi:enoyl-CoA hydratase [Rhodospirillum rubrum]|uniref:enoyl-CoA hydratase/isomerase family protein n=1 Tax=Rhodospirillum rubrum TaxID=1085 RepID=UPI0019064BAF|nr:enoyl-CoA hydratase/isomerase family protein [Rhodospirillum rubrum]MBK1665970.1 enoyl-CoA hydratase [Rhodospirillum rubrum]MBK1678080.1 enoyl-CoA hydratase [Rhodospirillum rubrum]
MDLLVETVEPRGVVRLTLNRPEVRNAFDDRLIAELTEAVLRHGRDPAVRVIVLAAQGRAFSAGADLGWMRRMADFSRSENLIDALELARMLQVIDLCPKPTVALVQGVAYGGGVGLVAACDIALAAEPALFCLSEVRLGLIPAVISPYVIRAIGPRACRRLFLTAETFGAQRALGLGLVSDVVAADALEGVAAAVIAALLAGAPEAQSEVKDLIRLVENSVMDEALLRESAVRIADRRSSDEGREGMAAFLEKRSPVWMTPDPEGEEARACFHDC